MLNATPNLTFFAHFTYQVGEIGDARQGLANNELESDGGQEEDERKLKAVLWQIQFDGERTEGKTADEQL